VLNDPLAAQALFSTHQFPLVERARAGDASREFSAANGRDHRLVDPATMTDFAVLVRRFLVVTAKRKLDQLRLRQLGDLARGWRLLEDLLRGGWLALLLRSEMKGLLQSLTLLLQMLLEAQILLLQFLLKTLLLLLLFLLHLLLLLM